MSSAAGSASAVTLLMLLGNLFRLALLLRQIRETEARSARCGRNARPGIGALWEIGAWSSRHGHVVHEAARIAAEDRDA